MPGRPNYPTSREVRTAVHTAHARLEWRLRFLSGVQRTLLLLLARLGAALALVLASAVPALATPVVPIADDECAIRMNGGGVRLLASRQRAATPPSKDGRDSGSTSLPVRVAH